MATHTPTLDILRGLISIYEGSLNWLMINLANIQPIIFCMGILSLHGDADYDIQLLESACPSVRWLVRPTLKNPASEIHASGSRIMDISIIHTCITHACIRIEGHIYMHQDQGLYTYMHHTCMHQDRGSYIYASWIHAYMHPGQGSRSYIYPSYSGSRITGICIVRIGIIPIYIRDKDQRYMHHT